MLQQAGPKQPGFFLPHWFFEETIGFAQLLLQDIPDIADWRSNVLGPANRFPKSRLVDVAKAYAFVRKPTEDVWIVPALMPVSNTSRNAFPPP